MTMSVRVTIVLNADIAKKLRIVQAKLVKESVSSVSFSRVVNEVLAKGFERVLRFFMNCLQMSS